jgi:hypothetical protein
MTEKQGVIYGIRHKADDKICYVGQTRMNPERRWRLHNSGKMVIGRAIQMMGGPDEFEFTILERAPVDELNSRERHWIRELNTLHPNGLNRTAGGSNGARPLATRAKISAAKKEACADPEYRAGLSERAKAIWSSPEGRAKRRSLWTDEKRAAAAARANELASDPEHVAKIAAATKAALADPERRAKQAQSNRRRWADPEERANQSARIKAAWARRRAEAANAGSART